MNLSYIHPPALNPKLDPFRFPSFIGLSKFQGGLRFVSGPSFRIRVQGVVLGSWVRGKREVENGLSVFIRREEFIGCGIPNRVWAGRGSRIGFGAGIKLSDASKKFGKKFASGASVVKVSDVSSWWWRHRWMRTVEFSFGQRGSVRGCWGELGGIVLPLMWFFSKFYMKWNLSVELK